MLEIQGITNDPKQKRSLVLPDGSMVEMQMSYVPLQQGWYVDYLSYLDFRLEGVRITNQVNMLYQFKNQIPFGFACFSDEDREPSLIEDFSSGASKLFLLTSAEVEYYAEVVSGQV